MKEYKNITNTIIGVNIASLVLYLFPPVIKESTNRILVVIYLLISIFLMTKGLQAGINKAKHKNRIIEWHPTNVFLTFLLFFYVLTSPFRYGYLMGLPPFDFQGMISRIMIGIAEPALGYQLSLQEGISPVPWSVFFLISIINDFFFIIFFCSWKRLSSFKKIVVSLYVTLELLFWLGRGTNFGIITMITNALIAYFIVNYQKPQEERKRLLGGRTVKQMVVLIVAFSMSIFVFSYLIIARTGEGDTDQSLRNVERTQQIDYDGFIVRSLPDNWIAPYYFVYSYTCQGYNNLGKAMNCEIQWTRFWGNNPRLMSLSAFLLRYDPMNDSYMVELERDYGVDAYVSWHSAYLWWANDFTIPGALVIVYLIAFLCGYAIVLAIQSNDLLSQIMAVSLSNILIFMFANNTYLALMFYSFMFVFPYWLWTRVIK